MNNTDKIMALADKYAFYVPGSTLSDAAREALRAEIEAVVRDAERAAEQQDAQAVSQGWKLVPVEPTPEMCNPSGDVGIVAEMAARYRREIWESMLNAAPTPPAQQDAQAVPPGYKLVPVEPTTEMVYAAQVEGNAHTDDEIVDDYRAMLNAAPTPPAQRVTLTPDEIDLIDSGMCGEREFSHNYAHAIIEAYERKNGIK